MDDLPPVLYHYTGAGGLTGILDPRLPDEMISSSGDTGGVALFQASDVRFMNDTKELRYGADLLVERLRADAEANPDVMGEIFAELADHFVSDLFTSTRPKYRVFAVCFCVNGDLLSQWRGYGGSGGYAIGFPTDVLLWRSFSVIRRPPNATTSSNTVPRKVLYGPDAESEVDDFIARSREAWAGGRLIGDGSGRPSLDWLLGNVYRFIAQLKDDAFSEEQEYRLIQPTEPGSGQLASVALRGSRLVPYVDIVLDRLNPPGVSVELPSLAEIVVGPGGDQDGRVIAVRDLLRSAGYPETPVRKSNATYRG